MENRVVITGMGIWSCLGKTLDEVRDALYAGKSGIVFSRERKDAGFRSALCAAVGQPDLKPFVSRNLRQFMPEEARYAYMATRAALEHAHLEQDYIDRHEVGVIYGNDSVAEATMRALDKFREFKDTAACGSGAIFQSMNSTVTMNLACLFHLRGINLTASAACASGSHAVGLAYLLVRNGMQDCVVCGGAQEANLYGVASFDGIQSFSVREDEPKKASRPFDRDRDGLVPGGGAATVVVEGYEHALKRSAPILCEIVGWGLSGNGRAGAVVGALSATCRGDTVANRLHQRPCHIHPHRRQPRGAGDSTGVRRLQGSSHFYQESDRARNVDGRCKRVDLFDADDEKRLHCRQHQLRASR